MHHSCAPVVDLTSCGQLGGGERGECSQGSALRGQAGISWGDDHLVSIVAKLSRPKCPTFSMHEDDSENDVAASTCFEIEGTYDRDWGIGPRRSRTSRKPVACSSCSSVVHVARCGKCTGRLCRRCLAGHRLLCNENTGKCTERKTEAKLHKENAKWLADANDRMSLLVAQPKSRPTQPVGNSVNIRAGPEAFLCIWCLSVDGVERCQTCGRLLCTECRAHHSCTRDVEDTPAVMKTSSTVLTFNCEFEVLRCMRTCRKVGFGLAAICLISLAVNLSSQTLTWLLTSPGVRSVARRSKFLE